jgi:WS/DGAT/MGAT family acyltransferase
MSHQHLSALDSTFLELEDADPTAHMHIGAVLVFDGPAPPQEDLLARLCDRLPALPRFRQQLLDDFRSDALHRPRWGAAPHFDPASHLGRAALPAPAGDEQLLGWAAEFYGRRLDRRRPLWEAVVVEGLADDRWALVSKVHHCLADGVGSLDALRLWIDGADAPPVHAPPGTSEPSAVDFARAGLDLALHPRRTLARSIAIGELAVREEIQGAPSCSLNQPIGIRRRLLALDCDLDGLRDIKNGLGGRVNDVILAVVATGLRALLQARDETLPAEGLRAMVPVNVRDDAGGGMGNQIVSLFIALPVEEPDALLRYERICEETAATKAGREPAGAAGLLGVGEWLPPILHAPFAKSLFGRRLFNLTVTNVPGPPFELHAFGSRLVRAVPLVPLAAEHAVGVAVLSYSGRVTFGVVVDDDSVPDVGVMVDAMEMAIADLTARADAADQGQVIAR